MQLYQDSDLFIHLKEMGIIDTIKLDDAQKEAQNKKIPLEEILLIHDLMSDENIGSVIADITGQKYINLSKVSILPDILRLIPEIFAVKQEVVAFKKDKEGLHIALSNPLDIQTVEFVKKKVGIPVVPYFATHQNISHTLQKYKKDVTKTFDDIINDYVQQLKIHSNTDPPIIKMVDTIIAYAQSNKASDIHIEPEKNHSLVRYRIDGILHDVITLPSEIHPLLITRIKVLSKLRTDEHQAPQDGKIQHTIEDSGGSETIDIRVSIVPIVEGEKAVLRLLSSQSRQFGLVDLGFSSDYLELITKAYQKPYGMILSTGPTGSGKTTTMYAILKILNQPEKNIMTIEDPVEYDIEGINQIQVNTKTSLTFANGLRSILRQDPNVILVGEIRDEETAGIAINAAMTGHLVLSTLHTNNTSTAIPRLIDMNIEPYLVASTVNCIVAQRLVRKICTECRISEEIKEHRIFKLVKPAVAKKIFPGKTMRVYKGKGCPVCHNTGYDGRVGIYEVMVITDTIRDAITSKMDSSHIEQLAISEGMQPMLVEGLLKVKEGITTPDEVMRVIQE